MIASIRWGGGVWVLVIGGLPLLSRSVLETEYWIRAISMNDLVMFHATGGDSASTSTLSLFRLEMACWDNLHPYVWIDHHRCVVEVMLFASCTSKVWLSDQVARIDRVSVFVVQFSRHVFAHPSPPSHFTALDGLSEMRRYLKVVVHPELLEFVLPDLPIHTYPPSSETRMPDM